MQTPQQIKDEYEVSRFDCQGTARIVMGDTPQLVMQYAFYSEDGLQLNVIDVLPTYTAGQLRAILSQLTNIQRATDRTFEDLGWTQQ